MSILVIVPVYNELDVLPQTIGHLREQGCNVHCIDNWSMDGSFEMLNVWPGVTVERFPADGPVDSFQWARILRRVELVAQQSDADWCMYQDADEIRRSQVPGETLAEAFHRLDKIGNAVSFRLFTFLPTKAGWTGEPLEDFFQYYDPNYLDSGLMHLKAWKNTGERVDLAWSGGHCVRFGRVCTSKEQLVLKHYPLRSTEQGRRKVFEERRPRWDAEERSRSWHVQYDKLRETDTFVWDTKNLYKYDLIDSRKGDSCAT